MWYRVLNLKIVRLAGLILGIYVAVQIGRGLWSLWGEKARVAEAQNTLDRLELTNTMLKDQEKQVGTPQFVERQAREKLGLVKPGEVIFVLPPGEVNRLAASLREEYYQQGLVKGEMANWQKWWSFFVD